MVRTWLKKQFGAGLLVLIPIAVTVWVLQTIILWCEGIFETLVPAPWRQITLFGWPIPGVGLLFTFLLVLFLGVLTRLYFGRKLLAIGDWFIHKIPLGRGVYTSVKQFLHALVSASGKNFRQVVLVEFPKPDSFMIGFVTGASATLLQKTLAAPSVNVFVPTSPNPTSGFLLVVPQKQVIPLDISPDQAFKLIVSGGTAHG